jgi:hypothetical protein
MSFVISIITGFGLIAMPMFAENAAYAQWIIPSQLNDAYRQQHIEDNNQTKLVTTIPSFIKHIPEK